MCKALDDWYQDGVNEGMEAGMERGMQLVRILFENHKMEELERAMKDKDYCKKLCQEYQITKLAWQKL